MDEPGSDFLARWRPHFEAAGLVLVVDFHGARAREQDELRAAMTRKYTPEADPLRG